MRARIAPDWCRPSIAGSHIERGQVSQAERAGAPSIAGATGSAVSAARLRARSLPRESTAAEYRRPPQRAGRVSQACEQERRVSQARLGARSLPRDYERGLCRASLRGARSRPEFAPRVCLRVRTRVSVKENARKPCGHWAFGR